MKPFVKTFVSGIAILFSFPVCAQQSILLNQTAYDPFIINPAAIGIRNDLTASCHYKKNWLNMTGSPELTQFTFSGPFSENKYGLGVNLRNERCGIFSKTYFSGAFRYTLNLAKKHRLQFGLSAGFQRQQTDYSKIKAQSPEEFDQLPSSQAITVPDASFGIAYTFKTLYIGLSANQILRQDFGVKDPISNQSLHYGVIPQYLFSMSKDFVIRKDVWNFSPTIILRSTQGLALQLDALASVTFKRHLLFGIGYRNSFALYSNLGFAISEKLRIIYSYEYSLALQGSLSGGHEIGLTFGFSQSGNDDAKSTDRIRKRTADELYEELDKQEQLVETLKIKVDSLDQHLPLMQQEISELQKKQVLYGEVVSSLDTNIFQGAETNLQADSKENTKNSPSKQQHSSYRIINPKTEKDYERGNEASPSNYKIVFGVYQLIENAKEYQKFLQREMSIETKLVQLNGHNKNFIYVCSIIEYSNMRSAMTHLKRIRNDIKASNKAVTYGEAWILQTLNK